MAEPWLNSAQAGRTGWVLPGKAQLCPTCPLRCPPGWVLLLARFWSLWGITCICISHSLSCILTSPPSVPHWALRWEVLSPV